MLHYEAEGEAELPGLKAELPLGVVLGADMATGGCCCGCCCCFCGCCCCGCIQPQNAHTKECQSCKECSQRTLRYHEAM